MSKIDYKKVKELCEEMKSEALESRVQYGQAYGALSSVGEEGLYAAVATFRMLRDTSEEFYDKAIRELEETLAKEDV
jgi:hypothetical protein